MSYTNRHKDAFHRTDGKKVTVNETNYELLNHSKKSIIDKNSKNDDNDKLRLTKSKFTSVKEERKNRKEHNNNVINRHTEYVIPPNDKHILVTKPTYSKSAILKDNSKPPPNPHQPIILRKNKNDQHFNDKKIISATNKSAKNLVIISDSNRSMSAAYTYHSKSETNGWKSFTHKQHLQSKYGYISQSLRPSLTFKQYNSSNGQFYQNYNFIKRHKSRPITKPINGINDQELVYDTFPRKSKIPSQTDGQHATFTKQISSDNLFIDTDMSRFDKISSFRKHNTNTSVTTSNVTDEDFINFSQTLARAATNSPPIKRRSSSIIHSDNLQISARFTTKNIIDQIYNQKSRSDNYEKYKKVASEILRENLALRFGENYPFNTKLERNSIQSSTSSLSSLSSATDRQNSISSIPRDDIPLNIPDPSLNRKISLLSIELIQPKNIIEINRNKVKFVGRINILEGTVTSEDHHFEVVNKVHLSDSESDSNGSDQYDLEPKQSSPESLGSDSDGDIEQLKDKFIPLHEIECMNDDSDLEKEHQYSQSIKLENTHVGSNNEIFVSKETLRLAKDALNRSPNRGILSKKSESMPFKKKRNAVFDPHILLLDACLEPNYEVVKELVPKVSNISKGTVDGITPLHNAVCSGDIKLVSLLIKSGANVNACDADGWTPLHCAACCYNRQIAKVLVENGASLFTTTLSENEISSQKCNKSNQGDTQCEEYLFWQQENLGVVNDGLVYALFEYAPQRNDELPLTPNQMLKIISTSPSGEIGWFFAENISEIVSTPKKGFVAAAYVSCYPIIIVKKEYED